jgi:predicted acyltransferase
VIAAVFALWSNRRGWIVATAGCLAAYWVLMRYVPVPGFGVPTHDMPLLDPDRNLVAWLDRKLLAGHLYDGTRDPEGLISTIPAIATCLLGLLTGDWLRGPRTTKAKVAGMAIFGVAGVVAGEIWNLWFPINKRLWTSSYVLLAAGLALLCLALCYWILDVKLWRGHWTTFFLVFGMNPIATYVLEEASSHAVSNLSTASGTSWEDAIYQHLFPPLASPANASLLYALCFVLMCWVPMWVLYRKRIFLKI